MRLGERSAGSVLEMGGEALLFCTGEPSADGLFADTESGGSGAHGGVMGVEMGDHFGAHERGEFGVSVHSVLEG